MRGPSITHPPAIATVAVILGVLAASIISCQEQTPIGPETVTLQAAKGGGGGKVKVADTDPSEAPLGTTLPVRVLGSGFDDGSTVEFTLGGISSPKVKTNSTQFVSSSELIADITIEADADEALYDVEVEAARGKRGIGVELFGVCQVPPCGNGGNDGGGGLEEPVRVVFSGDVNSGRVESFPSFSSDSDRNLNTFGNVLAGLPGDPIGTSFDVSNTTCRSDVDDPRIPAVMEALNQPLTAGAGHGVEVDLRALDAQSRGHAVGATFANTTFTDPVSGVSATGDFIVKVRDCPNKKVCGGWGRPVASIVAGPTVNANGETSTTYRFTGGQVTVNLRPPPHLDNVFIACQYTSGYVDAEVIENAVP